MVRLVFCGTPAFAVPTLRALVEAGHEIAMVVTQPDRAAGRGMGLVAPAVKTVARQLGLEIVQPEKIKVNQEFQARLEAIRPEAILIVAYGRIIPQWMLDLPPYGNINLHGSLLPKYRGAAPIQWAIAEGEHVTGVTTMRIDAGLDTGDLLLALAVPLSPTETAVELFESLANRGAVLMVDTLASLAEGKIEPRPQNHSQATLAPILKREDGLIGVTFPAKRIYDRWRGFQPWPGAWTTLRGKKFVAAKMRMLDESTEQLPGTLVVQGEELRLACGEGTMLAFEEVQLEGKKRMSAAEFLRGFQVAPGERIGA